MHDKNKRKKLMVYRPVQAALLGRMLLQWLAFVAVTCVVSMAMQYLMDPLQESAERAFQLRLTVGSILAVFVCLMPWFLYDAMRLSNRFVGPIVRLRTLLAQVGRGQVNRFNSRGGDYWHELASDFNEMLDRLEAQQNAKSNESAKLTR